jgi:hypothetical protein
MGHAFLTRNYVLVVLLVFFALTVSVWAIAQSAYLTTTPSVANQTQQQIETARQTVSPLSIFINNFLVSILCIVPVGGIIFFGKVWINTGQTIGQLAYAYPISPFYYIIGIYVPVGIIENMAYSVILAESLFLTYALAKGTLTERLKHDTWKSLILYLALLAIAAIVEAVLITGHL